MEYTNVRHTGEWTLLHNNQNISGNGELYLDPLNNVLTLRFSTKENIMTLQKPNRIIGKLHDRGEITLIDCEFIRMETKIPQNINVTDLAASLVIDGAIFEFDEEVTFNEICVYPSILDQWLIPASIESDFDSFENESIIIKRMKPICYKYNDQIDIEFYSIPDIMNFSYASVSLSRCERAYIAIKSLTPAAFDYLYEIANEVLALVAISTQHYPQLYEIRAYNNSRGRTITRRDGNDIVIPRECRIYKYDMISKDTVTNIKNHVIPLKRQSYDSEFFVLGNWDHQIQMSYQQLMQNWFEKLDIIKPVIERFLNHQKDTDVLPTIAFLDFVQTLESFHRRTKPNFKLDPAQAEKRKSEVLSCIPSVYEKWMKELLHYANEPSLQDRLEKLTLFEENDIYMFFNSGKERDAFIKLVKNTRNYFTHYDVKLENKILKGEFLLHACRKLKQIFEFNLYLYLGFDYQSLRSLFVSMHGYVIRPESYVAYLANMANNK